MLPATLPDNACVVIRDTETYSEQVTVQNFAFTYGTNTLRIMADPTFVSSAPVINPPTSSTAAFQIINASVTIQSLHIHSTNSVSYGIWASSGLLTVSSVNIESNGNIWTAGIWTSSYSAISYSSLTVQQSIGIWVTGELNSVTYSTMAGSGDPFPTGLYLHGASSNTVAESVISGLTLYKANYNTISHCYISTGTVITGIFPNASNFNTVTLSTVAGTGANTAALYITGDSNIISNSVITDPLRTVSIVDGGLNTIKDSVLNNSGSGGFALEIRGSSNSIIGSHIKDNRDSAVWLFSGNSPRLRGNNRISRSTITAPSAGVGMEDSASFVSDNHITASSGVFIQHATAAVISANDIMASGPGVFAAGNNNGMTISSNAFFGGNLTGAVMIEGNNRGSILISTNTLLPGSRYGISVASQAAGTSVWIGSNTVVLRASSSGDIYGIRLNGLITGATIQNNAIVLRQPASAGANTLYGFYVQNSSGINIDHNRINNPGMIAGGKYTAAYFTGSSAINFKFNDVNSTASATLEQAYLLQLIGSTVTIRNNIFVSSVAVSVSSASLLADVASGLDSDYNDWFSSNTYNTIQWGNQTAQFSSGWLGKDANSVSANPLWFNASAGVEDFHPLSMRGHYDRSDGTIDLDGQTSETIDAADPGEPVGDESAPNGGRANQGSHGQTVEASRSAPPPGSPVITTVNISSVTVSWGPVASDGYVAEASLSAAFGAIAASSSTTNPGSDRLAPQALIPNTTYFFRAGAVYGSNANRRNTVPASTATLAAQPATPPNPFLGVFFTSVTVQWFPNNNPNNTEFWVQASTDSNFNGTLFFPSGGAAWVNNTTQTVVGLAMGTTYYFEVRARNLNGILTGFEVLGSTRTRALSPPDSPIISAVNLSSIAVTYGLVGSDGYVVEASTAANFTGTIHSSASAAAANTLAPQALSANTTYFLRAGALWGSVTSYANATPISTATLAAQPATPANPFLGVFFTSATLHWFQNNNPANTEYWVQASTDSNFNGTLFFPSGGAAWVNSTTQTVVGLSLGTSYYFEVRARNWNGVMTGFEVLGGTQTKNLAPPGSPIISAVNLSSIAVTYGLVGSDGYVAEASTASNFTGTLFSSASAVAVSTLAPQNLSPNTTYFLRAGALWGNATSYANTAPTSTATLAAQPAAPANPFLGVFFTSATVHWFQNDNPANTEYFVQ
ncbi:MAG: right-handed parallel beta-helix repeat-containing protein, partial [Elusimicrobia bacterium]|nr:right-handed parallel beta-helix repeat-containing protein [Elusimicrobiota bacterium]